MPYIQVRTNKQISKEVELKIKERLGQAINLLGKSENWLMVEIVADCHLYFKGNDNEDYAYVDVKLYGNGSREAFNNMTATITEILNSNLEIKPDNIYVSYLEVANWGWNGSNF